MTFEDYLRGELSQGKIDFQIRIQARDGKIVFYIHPEGRDGFTGDFMVSGDTVSHVLTNIAGI